MASKTMEQTIAAEAATGPDGPPIITTVEMTPAKNGNYTFRKVDGGTTVPLPPNRPWATLKRKNQDGLRIVLAEDLPLHERKLSFEMKLSNRGEPGWVNPFQQPAENPGDAEGTSAEADGVFNSRRGKGGPNAVSFLVVTARPLGGGKLPKAEVPFSLEVEGYPRSHDPDAELEC